MAFKHPKYRLHYFNNNLRAEPVRMLFSYGKIPFDDVRYEISNWPNVRAGTPLDQLPYLEIDDKIVTQNFPICRYLANMLNLAGNNIEENLRIDAAVEMVMEISIDIKYVFREKEEGPVKERLKEKMNSRMAVMYGFLDRCAEKNGGYIALNRLTWADFIFVWTYEYLGNKFLPEVDIFADYPNLKQVVKNFLKVKNLRDWIEKRPAVANYTYDLKDDL